MAFAITDFRNKVKLHASKRTRNILRSLLTSMVVLGILAILMALQPGMVVPLTEKCLAEYEADGGR